MNREAIVAAILAVAVLVAMMLWRRDEEDRRGRRPRMRRGITAANYCKYVGG